MSLIHDIERGDLEAVKSLINPTNVNNYPSSDTPLNLAAFFGQIEISIWLIESGSDVNRPGIAKITPLMRAYQNNQPEIARLLIAFGADKDHLKIDSPSLRLCTSLKKHELNPADFLISVNDVLYEVLLIGDDKLEGFKLKEPLFELIFKIVYHIILQHAAYKTC